MMVGFRLLKFTVKNWTNCGKEERFSVLEYYTTDSACPWKTGGPVNSSSVNLACLRSSSPQHLRGRWWPTAQTCSGRGHKGAKAMKSDIYQTETFLPGMAHLHGSLDLSASTKQTLSGMLRNSLLLKQCLHSQTQNLPLMSSFSVHHVDPLFLQEHRFFWVFLTVSSLDAWFTPTFNLSRYYEIKLSVALSNHMLVYQIISLE